MRWPRAIAAETVSASVGLPICVISAAKSLPLASVVEIVCPEISTTGRTIGSRATQSAGRSRSGRSAAESAAVGMTDQRLFAHQA